MAAEVTTSTDELLPARPELPLGTFLGHFQLILIDLSARLTFCLPFYSPLGESSAFQFFFLSFSLRKVTNNSLEKQYVPTIYEFLWTILEVFNIDCLCFRVL